MRYDGYGLTPDDFVIDCGGYHGQWTKGIVERYNCWVDVFEPVFWRQCAATLDGLPKVTLHPVAVGARNDMVRIGIRGDMTGIFCDEPGGLFPCIDLNQWLSLKDRPEYGLCKLNVEGAEFELIDRLVHSGLIRRIRNLQVQFHNLQDWCKEYQERLRAQLDSTHYLTYDFDVWSNWRRKE